MTTASPVIRPGGAAMLCQIGRRVMDVVLHVGAHRTATTSFQKTMYANEMPLSAHKIAFWGPRETRRSIFPGLFRTIGVRPSHHIGRRAEGLVQMKCAQIESAGTRHLLVSEENMIGSSSHNIQNASLYPAIGERMARVAAAFEGRIVRVVLSLRAQDLWWASAAALTVARGHMVPSPAKCRAIAQHPRSWRHVITDMACALPDTDIQVLPFEHVAGRPLKLLSVALGPVAGVTDRKLWLNRSADLHSLRQIVHANDKKPAAMPKGQGRWQPFTTDQCATLRETYADDLHWLRAGADGLARLTENTSPTRADQNLPLGPHIKGHGYEQGQLAQNR